MIKNKLTPYINLIWHFKIVSAMISLALFFVVLLAINRSVPITKNEMLEIAKSHRCSIRLELYFRDEITSYDTCIRALKSDFLNLSISDRTNVAAMFILYEKIDAGASVAFVELIEPDRISILKKLESFSDMEIRNKFNASDSMIIDYRKTIFHYRELFDRELKESMVDINRARFRTLGWALSTIEFWC